MPPSFMPHPAKSRRTLLAVTNDSEGREPNMPEKPITVSCRVGCQEFEDVSTGHNQGPS